MRTLLALLVVVGCSDGAGSSPDAPVDAIEEGDADPALVTLTITDGGVPAVGATVYFQNPDSSLVRMTMTDIDGTAKVPMPDGGFVTAIEPRPVAFGVVVIRDRLATFAGVKPGDDLHLDVRPPTTRTTVVPLVQVPADPGAEGYELFSTCGRATFGVGVATTPAPAMLTNCGGIADMVVLSRDIQTSPLHTLYRAAQPVADGATITLTEPYTDLVPVALTIVGSPAWVGSYSVELDVVTARGPLFPVFVQIDPAAPIAAVALPAATGATMLLRADAYLMPPAVSRQTMLAWGVPFGDHALDAGAAALRPITSTPVFDPATRTVTWTDDTGGKPDVVRTEVYTYRDGDPAHAWTWQLVAPYDRPSLTYPVLLGDAATSFTTRATDSFAVQELETVAVDGGYDRIRSRALRRGLDVALPGAVGRLTYQRLYDPNQLVTPTLGPPTTFTRATR